MASIFEDLDIASTFVEVLGDDELARYSLRDGSWSGDLQPIFDDPAMLTDTGNGPGSIDRAPRFHFVESAMPPGYGQGDIISFRAKDYTIRAALPDGHGMVVCHVEPTS